MKKRTAWIIIVMVGLIDIVTYLYFVVYLKRMGSIMRRAYHHAPYISYYREKIAHPRKEIKQWNGQR